MNLTHILMVDHIGKQQQFMLALNQISIDHNIAEPLKQALRPDLKSCTRMHPTVTVFNRMGCCYPPR